MDDGLKRCFKQKKGMKLIKPSENLAKEYMKSAEETLFILQTVKGKSNMWLATTKYYTEYFAVYALLMKIGIKSEIHDCTIELCKFLEKQEIIPKGFSRVLEDDKEIRIDNQYYLKNKKVNVDIKKLRDFIFIIKHKINIITFDELNEIRGKLKKL